MGISQSGAHKLVTTALKELNLQSAESAAELRRLELERLDEWLLRVAQEIKNGKALTAIDRSLRIQARRAKLLGLDAPTRMTIDDLAGYRFHDLAEAAEAGNESALEALQKIAEGGDAAAICEDWVERNRLPLASEAETAKMTREELVKAAQGKLTHKDLAAIRNRPGDDAEAEGR